MAKANKNEAPPVETTVENTETNDLEIKRPKKLTKEIVDGKVYISAIDGVKGRVEFDPALLNEDIQKALIPFGLNHKLGDSAAGKSGVEAEDAIAQTWAGLLEGKWTVRVAAGPKVSVRDIESNIAALPEADQEAAKALLKALGISIPGIS